MVYSKDDHVVTIIIANYEIRTSDKIAVRISSRKVAGVNNIMTKYVRMMKI